MALLQAKTRSGLVEGLPAGNQSITLFKGIPFAKPPVGPLRWKAPQPPEPWQGVRPAYQFGPIAMQCRFVSEGGGTSLAAQEFYVREWPMSEDCLYLNIWTPAQAPGEKLPVAVYIHGGGFETGYSYLNAYDGEGFAKRGVVMVTIGYRLGVFGYLASPELEQEDPEAVGNYGTLDCIAALEWVRDNIDAFGGDAGNVTIFGQSAGGYNCMALCACPRAKGLFHHAIFQSGGGLYSDGCSSTTALPDALPRARQLWDLANARDLAQARALPAEALISAFEALKGGPGYSGLFSPVYGGGLMPHSPGETFRLGLHPDIDYMLGCTADEMRSFGAPAPAPEKRLALAQQEFGPDAQDYLNAIHAEDDAACRPYYENFLGDEMLAGDIAFCENQLALGRSPAHLYYFTYVPPGAEAMGAHHSVEHHYVFQTLLRSHRPYGGADFELSNELADAWASFCRTGDPNPAGCSRWKPYTAEAPLALIVDGQRRMGPPPRGLRIDYLVRHARRSR